MKEPSLSFNRYLTHGSPTLLFSWCFIVSSPCFYIQTPLFAAYTHTQATLIYPIIPSQPTASSMWVCSELHVCSFVSVTVCLCPSVHLLAEPQGTLAVWCNVPRGRTLLAAPPEGDEGGGGRGNRGTFPVEMGLSLHQLLLQLQREASRSLGTKPIGTQMGTDVETCTSITCPYTYSSYSILLYLPLMLYLCLSRWWLCQIRCSWCSKFCPDRISSHPIIWSMH